MQKSHDLTGLRFGRLVVVARIGRTEHRDSLWRCVCDCSIEKVVGRGTLVRGRTRSCGCLSRDRAIEVHTTHGHARVNNHSRTYRVWTSMWSRCTNPKTVCWVDYGGRGISVCERWKSYKNFLTDMGEAPPNLSLDRVDNDKGYMPDNCRWATQGEQSINKRNNRLVTIGDETKPLSLWLRESGISFTTALYRLKRGWESHKAIFEPPDEMQSRRRRGRRQVP